VSLTTSFLESYSFYRSIPKIPPHKLINALSLIIVIITTILLIIIPCRTTLFQHDGFSPFVEFGNLRTSPLFDAIHFW
jgi:hypothetical protein